MLTALITIDVPGIFEKKVIENQIKLIEHLRSQGYRDSILVYISW